MGKVPILPMRAFQSSTGAAVPHDSADFALVDGMSFFAGGPRAVSTAVIQMSRGDSVNGSVRYRPGF